jgi:transcriptional regulator with XRE-family HTH domain
VLAARDPSKTLTDSPLSKNCSLNRDVECPSVGMIALASGQPWRLAHNLPRKMAPNPIDQYVGSRVRMRRKMLGMSQEKLGGALSLTFQQVQKYEKGASRIGASRLQQISHVLQVPVEFFFEGAPNASAPHGSNGSTLSMAEINNFISDPDGLRLIGAFMRINNAAVRRRIVKFMQEIAGNDD